MGRSGQEANGHRLWAAVALVLAIATVVFAIDVVFQRIPRGLIVVACVVVAVVVAAYGLVRRGAVRVVAVVVAVLLLAAGVTLVFVEGDPWADVLIAAGVVATLAAGRRAFRVHVRWPQARRLAHPVLFYNPFPEVAKRSGLRWPSKRGVGASSRSN